MLVKYLRTLRSTLLQDRASSLLNNDELLEEEMVLPVHADLFLGLLEIVALAQVEQPPL